MLAFGDPKRADPALWALVAKSQGTVAWLQDQLQPARIDQERIATRIAELDHKQFAKREAAYTCSRLFCRLLSAAIR